MYLLDIIDVDPHQLCQRVVDRVAGIPGVALQKNKKPIENRTEK